MEVACIIFRYGFGGQAHSRNSKAHGITRRGLAGHTVRFSDVGADGHRRGATRAHQGGIMLTREENELLCHVGPGTPGGEYLRRYWQPVGLSTEVTPGSKPLQVRVLGEDLVLFRDDAGRPGLIEVHCSHRLASLAYGRVEDGGLRCPFHGWLYDVNGHCLDQPAEPDESNMKYVDRHPAYP